MTTERPDLSNVAPDIVAYIEALERQLLEAANRPTKRAAASTEPSEPPTTTQIITMTVSGLAKRTARHLYIRQRRSGMGVFDIETTEDDPPKLIAEAKEAADLIVITNQGRAFRLPVIRIADAPLRGRGEPLADLIDLLDGELVVALLPAGAGKYVILASERGWIRRIRDIQLSAGMIPGIRYHKTSQGGDIVGACWSDGDGDVLLLSQSGKGIRFRESQVHSSGVLGMRVDIDDVISHVVATSDKGGVFVVSDEGKGSVRLMEGFRQNKAPGAGGKVILKAERLAGAVAIKPGDELFVISQLSKVIRFFADEVPPKTGVVQGVNIINLRADEVAAVGISRIPPQASE